MNRETQQVLSQNVSSQKVVIYNQSDIELDYKLVCDSSVMYAYLKFSRYAV